MRVEWTDAAKSHARAVARRIAVDQHAPMVAVRIYSRIIRAADSLADHPLRHEKRSRKRHRFNLPGLALVHHV